MNDQIFNVLFLCTGNSARSIMAEAILNRLGRGRFHGYSAGSQPRGEIQPMALDILRRSNHPVDGLRSKDWTEFAGEDALRLDFVFTLCDQAAAESCPVWPGQPMSAHWGLPDPAAAQADDALVRLAYADAYRMLHNRIDIFINLPLTSLDQLTLQRRLEDIGKVQAEQQAAPA